MYTKFSDYEEKVALSNEIIKYQKRLYELENFSKEALKSGGVFISYSHCDKDIIDLIVTRFQVVGINYWRDDKDMLIGQVIDKAISEGIQKSWLFLILLTPTSISSKWVEREFDEASYEEVIGKKVILPVIAKGLEMEKLPPRIRRKNCADITKNFEDGYERLQNSIIAYLKDLASKTIA